MEGLKKIIAEVNKQLKAKYSYNETLEPVQIGILEECLEEHLKHLKQRIKELEEEIEKYSEEGGMNNAVLGLGKKLLALSDEEFKKVMDENVTGKFGDTISEILKD